MGIGEERTVEGSHSAWHKTRDAVKPRQEVTAESPLGGVRALKTQVGASDTSKVQAGRAGGLTLSCPEIIKNGGEKTIRRFFEFFTVTIRNKNTRAAYAAAVGGFLTWCEERRLSLSSIEPMMVAAYVEGHPASAPTVKQHLAAIRMLFDYLVTGGVLEKNPAASVRGPRHVVKKGKTPVLTADETRKLLDSIDLSTATGLRDRAMIAVMVYSFARVSAVCSMKRSDFYQNGKRWWLRLTEKGGRYHEVPAHHNVEAYVDSYLEAVGGEMAPSAALFQTAAGRSQKLTGLAMSRRDALAMVKRRAKTAGLSSKICNHSFRATGITVYLKGGGTLENAQLIAAHESPRTTKLYDRRSDDISLDEIERIVI